MEKGGQLEGAILGLYTLMEEWKGRVHHQERSWKRVNEIWKNEVWKTTIEGWEWAHHSCIMLPIGINAHCKCHDRIFGIWRLKIGGYEETIGGCEKEIEIFLFGPLSNK